MFANLITNVRRLKYVISHLLNLLAIFFACYEPKIFYVERAWATLYAYRYRLSPEHSHTIPYELRKEYLDIWFCLDTNLEAKYNRCSIETHRFRRVYGTWLNVTKSIIL